MNKYQEALDELGRYISNSIHASKIDTYKKRNQAGYYLNILNELVEKATPKDPPLYQDYDLKKEFWECPTCGSFLCENGEEYGHGGYCEHCGQRILWESEEE